MEAKRFSATWRLGGFIALGVAIQLAAPAEAMTGQARGPRRPRPPASPASPVSCVTPPPDLIAWWPGDGDGRDLVAGRDGVPVNGASFAPGMVLEAFNFGGSSWVEVADDPIWNLGLNDFTIDLWAQFSALSGRDPLVAHDQAGGQNNKWIFWYDASGHDKIPGTPALRFHLNSPHPGPLPFPHDAVAAPWSPVAGVWYHLAVTRLGATWSLYVDGVMIGNDTSAFPVPDPAAPLTLGQAESFRLAGSVDEVEFHLRALTAQEIAGIHAAGAAGKCKDQIPVGQ